MLDSVWPVHFLNWHGTFVTRRAGSIYIAPDCRSWQPLARRKGSVMQFWRAMKARSRVSRSGAGENPPSVMPRPSARGKFLFVDEEKFLVRGVTYGPFRPDERGCAYHNPDVAHRDFAVMVAHGINSIRTYTCPPRWLLDVAAEHNLRVMAGVGLAGEQLSAFLDDRKTVHSISRRCAEEVRACAGHPALLAYSIGNEIPSTIVRWHGRRRVERFLRDLCDIVRQHDSESLVTYVNYPTTEYLQLPFLDFLSYNVYLEAPDRFEPYLARLQNIADYKPLLMAEIGLDSLRNGPDAQARSLGWQIRASFAGGCAGVYVFSWTDEWHTGGCDVEDWKFGITDSKRLPKPALSVVKDSLAAAPLPTPLELPKISVVVCTHNGSRTIRNCLEGCARLRYPEYETIVVNDGSTDSTADIVRGFDVRLISTPNQGLSHARNVGLNAATGQFIAYLDDDARPDEHWLSYLAHTFLSSDHVGVGGPNIVPVDDPPFSQCVANSPGGPTHVLISDHLAEHIPGCNMAFRVQQLREVGGFDAQFRIAGDDVDVCWKLQARGWTLGFTPAAVVWHHRRCSLRAYWKQQFNYGCAEAMLEVKWPEKYNALGHVGWRGRLYGTGACSGLGWWASRVYHGVWATSAFQPLCERDSIVAALPITPEWYLIVLLLLLFSAFGMLWPPLLACLPIALLGAGASVVQATRSAGRAMYKSDSRRQRLKLGLVTTLLHVIQPAARLWGRLSYGLTPWRRKAPSPLAIPLARTVRIWCEHWQTAEERLKSLEAILREAHAPVRRGGAYDRWDLQIRGGLLGSVRTRLAIEEYPRGRQYLRFRAWPCFFTPVAILAALSALLAIWLGLHHLLTATAVLAGLSALLFLRALGDCSAAMAGLSMALRQYGQANTEAIGETAPAVSTKEADAQTTVSRIAQTLPGTTTHIWRAQDQAKTQATQPGESASGKPQFDSGAIESVRAT
jgi:GT2 family glycosyltransferase